jgi:diguanylate cyclase (GGDEF)-like protein/PAS domain S-box-containing protein
MHIPKPAERAEHDDQMADAVLAEQIRLLILGHRDHYANLLIAILTVPVIRLVYPGPVLAVWVAGMLGMVILRRIMVRCYQKAAPDPRSNRRWAIRFAAGAGLAGVLWGVVNTVPLVTASFDLQCFSIMLAAGMFAGGVMINAAYFPAVLVFGLPIAVPCVLVSLSRWDMLHAEIAALMSLFFGVLTLSGRNLNRMIVENIRIKLGREDLLAKLRSSEAGMAEAQQITHVGSWELDLRTNRITASDETYRIFGLSRERFVPTFDNALARAHPDDRPLILKNFADSLSGKAAFSVFHRIIMDDGTMKYIHQTIVTSFSPDGQALRSSGTIQDVTEQRLAENRLKLANMLLKTQMETSREGIMVVDANRHLTAYNQRLAEMWQLPKASLLAHDDSVLRPWIEGQISDPKAYEARAIHLVTHPEEVGDAEIALADGRCFQQYTSAMQGPDGEDLGRVWYFTDITARKQAEDVAKERDRLLAQVQVSVAAMAEAQSIAKVGSWELDLSTNLVTMSREAYRIFAADPSTFKPSYEAIMGIVLPEDRAAVAQSFADAKAGRPGANAEHRLTWPDGTTRYLRETPVAIFDADGHAVRISGVVEDITDERLLDQRLKLSNLILTTQMEVSPDGIMVVDAHRHVTASNRRVVEMWKLPEASLLARDDKALRACIESQLKDPNEFDARARNLVTHPDELGDAEIALADGRFFKQYSRAMRGPDGESLGRVWFFSDITERKQAADALAYRDHLLHTVTAAMAVAVGAMALADGVNAALVKIGESMDLDRISVIQDTPLDDPPLATRFLWEVKDIAVPFVLASRAQKYDPAQMAAWRRPLRDGLPVFADAATAKGAVAEMMACFKIQSSLLVPVYVGGAVWGFLGIDLCRSARRWAVSEIETMKILADVAGSLIVRERARVALEASENRFRLLTATATDAVITTDKAGHILEWNPGAERIYGFGAAEAMGKQIGQLLQAPAPPEALDPTLAAGDAIAGSTLEMRVVRKGGKAITVELSISGAMIGAQREIISISRDITERKAAEAKLLFANILLKTEMEASPDGILVVDSNRRIVSYNQRFADMWQVPQAVLDAGDDDVLLAHVAAFFENPGVFIRGVAEVMSHPERGSAGEVATVDGRVIERHSVALAVKAIDYLGRVWFFRDVTERRAADALALRHARHDVLTGLANRAVFVEAVRDAIAAVKRDGKLLAILYIDLDHFKDVNDTLGHPVGDALLQAVAARLLGHTRASDTVARFGGDEFAILAADIAAPEDAGFLASKIVAAISEPFMISGNNIHTEASIGIDMHSPKAADAETLLSHADVALYRAKTEGRGTFRFFTDAMDTLVRRRVNLSMELRAALARGELFLLYQPQVEAKTGQIVGLEALVRWRHPRRGLLGPDAFIPVAEVTGIIGKLGHFVLWETCRQARRWLDLGLQFQRISVNVSALQFRNPQALEADIAAALLETRLPAALLELELTESVLMDASREHNGILVRLRALGVKLAIDDFGTGFSSLDYLRRFPANHIKVAQSFTRNIETHPGDATIVRAVIGLANELDIAVIAEGIETRAQLDLVRSWGCHLIQGFYFARPLPADEITALLSGGGVIDRPDAG